MLCNSLFRFLDRTLSALANTQIQIDPDITPAHELRRWYLEEGMNVEMSDLTNLISHEENSKEEINRLFEKDLRNMNKTII